MTFRTTSLAAVVLLAGSGADGALIRQFDASLDAPGDSVWANTGTANTGQANNFSFATAQTPSVITDAFAPGITAAYDISVTGQVNGTDWSYWGQSGGGRANVAENTFEVFFRMDNLAGQHLIMEIGGAAAGVSIGVDGDQLVWATNPAGTGTLTTKTVSAQIGLGWHQAVATWNRNTLTSSLYVDGQFVGSVALDEGTVTGWNGSNEATLGGVNTSAATTFDLQNITTFDGAINAFNYYNEELDAQTIADNFDAKIVPGPASLALLGVGGLAAARRRRS